MLQSRAIRKAQPTPGDVHVNRPLTNISVAFSQGAAGFIATTVFPVVPVASQSDQFFVFDRENWLVGGAQKRGPSAESAGGGYSVSTQNYRCDVWALHKDVGDQVRANSDTPLRPDQNATNWVTENMMITRDQEWAEKYFAASIWTNETDGVTGAPGANQFQFWDESGSTPILDIRAAMIGIKGSTGFKPNKLVLGAEVWNILIDHPDFLDRINQGQTPGGPALVMRQLLTQILELEDVVVAEAVVNSAVEGATESTDFIFGKSALLVHAAPNPGLEIPSAGYTFAWTGLLGAGASGTRISRFRMEEKKTDRIEGESAYEQNLVSADLGHFFATAIA